MSIAEAARLILEGGLVAFPTETVYGLGGDATNERAVADQPRGLVDAHRAALLRAMKWGLPKPGLP